MTARVLVAGGNGRLGRAVLATLGERGVMGVRRPDIADTIVIDSNGQVNPAMLDGIRVIINCAGSVTGTQAGIDQANITYPATLARIARDAGVARFVQVSSFSVYGRTEQIDQNSVIAPDGAYGRSKVAAEHALTALATHDFAAIPLRLPFMFSVDEPALLGRLIPVMLKLRMLPTPPEPHASRRSMITYGGAAEALVMLADAGDLPDDVPAAADPEPLDLTVLAGMIYARLGKRILTLPVPDAITALLRTVAPGIVDRLLRSSVLAPPANLLAGGTRHPVATELSAYLDSLASRR